MVSDGKDFKLLISVPTPAHAVVGADRLSGAPSKNGLENLRPYIIRDALQIPPVAPDEFVTLTENARILAPAKGKKDAIEEPDYDVTVLRTKQDHVLERVRVIHIARETLQPYQQDIYDDHGRVVTVVNYARYGKSGDVDFPMSIDIRRPLDEYELKIEFTKLALNGKLDDEQFVLKIPEGIPVQKM